MKRITQLWHVYGMVSENDAQDVIVGPSSFHPDLIPKTEPSPIDGTPLPYIASLSHDPSNDELRALLGLPDDFDLQAETIS
jgi:hypothetical protein